QKATLHNLQFPYSLGRRYLYAPSEGAALFTDNESNAERLYSVRNRKPYVKDAFHRHIVNGENCVNPTQSGTKACIHYTCSVPAGESVVLRLRLTPGKLDQPLEGIDKIVAQRRKESDEFYAAVHPPKATAEENQIQRQALAGMLWSKQI